MPFSLEELRHLVQQVAREQRLDVDVVGVTPGEGDGLYAEVIVDVRHPDAGAERRSVGLQRDASAEHLRVQIADKLDIHPASSAQPGPTTTSSQNAERGGAENRVENLSSDVDDALISVDELQNEPGAVTAKTINRIKDALQTAKDTLDEVENAEE